MIRPDIQPEIADAKPCWRTIGVRGGDHSCPRLIEVIHCRNCPVFGEAARSLFDRFEAVDVAATEHEVAQSVDERSALVFRLGNEWLAIRTGSLAEVTEDLPVRRIAHRTQGRLEGVVNVRGELRMCVALVEVLELGTRGAQSNAEARLILLLEGDGGAVAFRADEVAGLQRFGAGDIEAPPAGLPDALKRCADGMVRVSERHVLLLRDLPLLAALGAAIAS